MEIKQVSIFIENKKGRLADVTKTLADNGINIRALSLAETTDFGILRLIVNDPDRCQQVLSDAGFSARETEVIAVEVPDTPGGLADVLAVFDKAGINVEYMYAFVEKSQDNAVVIFRIDEQGAAVEALDAAGMRIVSDDVLKKL